MQYYDHLIDTLLENHIEPMVTMYHYDLPQALQEQLGGLVNSRIIAYFEQYAHLLFSRFGNRVSYQIIKYYI